MRAIMTGGGSGGHIYPALAIADKIKQKDPDSEILYIGNDLGLEKDILPDSGYPFELVKARWFEKNPVELLKTGVVTMQGRNQALKIMKKFKPDVVIGTGGFVCVPVMLAGKKYGARCYIHEQNAYPGVANRFLEGKADKIFLGFAEASHYLRHPEKQVVTGNPVRSRFFNINKERSRKKLGISDDDFVIFSFAGSQGANQMNAVIYEFMKTLNGRKNVVLLFGTGTMHYGSIMDRVKTEKVELQDNIRIEAYITEMQEYLGAADLIIGRAGALSAAEICMCGRPSILVPSPNVPGNHQFYNAKAVADAGGAILIEEKDFTLDRLVSETEKLMKEPETLESMGKAAYKNAPKNATDIIYSVIKD